MVLSGGRSQLDETPYSRLYYLSQHSRESLCYVVSLVRWPEGMVQLMATPVQRRSWGRSNDIALLLCVIEVTAILGGVFTGVFFNMPKLLTRFTAVVWLACGLGSLAFSVAGMTAGSHRKASVWMILLSLTLFLLCGFRFALV
jgi:hypothetical protein